MPAPPKLGDTTAPDTLVAPEAAADTARLPAPDSAAPPEAAPPGTPAPASLDTAPAADQSAPEPAPEPAPTPPQEPLLEPAPSVQPEPKTVTPKIISPSGEAMPGTTERLISPDGAPLTAKPSPDAQKLPRIGDAPSGSADGSLATLAPEPTPATPLDLFSRPFENVDAKPLFSILLMDDGDPATDRETLAALPFPVTFVLDPLAPGAPEAASIYRAAGQEVVMLANAIPAGAKPADLEQSLQALDLALPDAVAVMGGEALSQEDRQLASALVPIVAAQGRGLVTMDKGLNALAQVARREKLPSATIFRRLDAANETVPVIRRYLDRAAFRAAQEGSVVVIGTTKPDTIAAILQWNVEGRAASVALAPISAVMREAAAQ